MNNLHSVLVYTKRQLWHIVSKSFRRRKCTISSNHIVLVVLLLGVSSGPDLYMLFVHKKEDNYTRYASDLLNPAVFPAGTRHQYGAVSDLMVSETPWKNQKPVFQINQTARITGIRG
ncbi:hypothetical protein ACLPHM_04345 [Paenalcaligenes sp. Me131]|uniref:hypothetical protein n=1 Tax=Paenalcaligenes sp. Me131 TaxID=3392636 RepID=UPI003D28B588